MTFSNSVFLLLVIVLSMDSFTAGFSYGIEKVRVPFSSSFTAALISGTMLTFSLWMGDILAERIPEALTKSISFLVLFLLALYKFYDTFPFLHNKNAALTTKVISKKINRKPKEVLSFSEALLLALALSADNISAGLCNGLPLLPIPLTFLVTTGIHLTALLLGILTGKSFAQKCSADFSWLGAIILMLLAFGHLF